MYYTVDFYIYSFPAWGGAENTKQNILNANLEDEFDLYIHSIFCNEMPTKEEVNNFLYYDSDKIYEALGLDDDGEDPNRFGW
ncbi:MAG: hypothetical protein RSF40_02095 [Oscillospiraceae bacterium]